MRKHQTAENQRRRGPGSWEESHGGSESTPSNIGHVMVFRCSLRGRDVDIEFIEERDAPVIHDTHTRETLDWALSPSERAGLDEYMARLG